MPQKKKLLTAALGALFTLSALFTTPACAADSASPSPVTANISIENNYLYRGISRTSGLPAVQGGIDMAASNGLYLGVWGSNSSWVADRGMATGASLEFDAYAGIKNNFYTDFTYDFGVLRYHFPGVYNAGQINADTDEVHAELGYAWFAAKYSYALGNTFGVADAKGTNYIDLSADYPVSDTGVTLGAHYGKQKFKGTGAAALAAAGQDPSYADYKLSISKELSGYVLGLAYSKTNTAKGAGTYYNVFGRDLGRTTAIFSVKRTF